MRAPFSYWAMEDRVDYIIQTALAAICGLIALLALVAAVCGAWWQALIFLMAVSVSALCLSDARRTEQKYENLNI